ncbi:MAG: hypothetical protein HYY25_05835 [Candidatus Wallbacteria bacterium]|nr:hypothetical protein [Candidatus Wallbacteria bacterium]
MSLDVVELELGARRVTLRYSTDSAAGAFTGDVTLLIGPESQMAAGLFEALQVETRRRCGMAAVRSARVRDNVEELRTVLGLFLRTFRVTLDAEDLEPMEMALARTAGIDFMAQSISLWDKELPERVEILLRRAASNLQFGYPDECSRDLAKVELLDPGNRRAEALRSRLGAKSPAVKPAPTGGVKRQRTSARPAGARKGTKKA